MNPFDEDAEKQKKVDEVSDILDDDKWAELGKMRSSVSLEHFDVKKLFCYGCGHDASGSDFPGKPSGERPCFFCIRNPDREEWQKDQVKRHGQELREWYDNSPIAFYPIDCYQTMDMSEQQERWERRAKGESDWNSPRGGLRFG